VPHRGRPLARGHLRVAIPYAPKGPPRSSRLLLLVRAVWVALSIYVANVLAFAAAAVALFPLVTRRAPLGRRQRPVQREARVIPWPMRRASRR
jgi:hypothetical protein